MDAIEIKYSYEIHYCYYVKRIVYFINKYKFINGTKRLHTCKIISDDSPEIKKLEGILFLKGIILKSNDKREIDSKMYKLILKTITLT